MITASNSPAVLTAEGFGDGETEAGAFLGFIGLIETIEDFFEVRGFDLDGVVWNRKGDLSEMDFQGSITMFNSVIEENVENLENILFG